MVSDGNGRALFDENQAAVPARSPPALLRACGNRPVADHHADHAVVGPKFIVVLVGIDALHVQVDAEPVVDPARTNANFDLASRRILKRANAGRVIGRADFGVERQFLGARFPAGSIAYARKRVAGSRRQTRRIGIAQIIENRSPGQRPGRGGTFDDAGIGQDLDVVPQRQVAGGDVGSGVSGGGSE